MPTTDYTRKTSNQLRAATVPGMIANIIQRLEQQPRLPQLQTAGFGFGTSGVSGQCGLTFGSSTLNFGNIPANMTGAVLATTTVTSTIAQTVTFTAAFQGASPACLSPPTVSPSTFTFTAGQQATIVIRVAYANCAVGASATVVLSASAGSGCTISNAGSGTATTTTTTTQCQNTISAPIWVTANGPWAVYLCKSGTCPSDPSCYICASGPANTSNIVWTPVFNCQPPSGYGSCIYAGGFQWGENCYGAGNVLGAATGPGAGGTANCPGSGTLCQKQSNGYFCYNAAGICPTGTCGC